MTPLARPEYWPQREWLEYLEEYLTERQAAEFLKRGKGTLANWRSEVRGPAYEKGKDGGIRYKRVRLIEWQRDVEVLSSDTPSRLRRGRPAKATT